MNSADELLSLAFADTLRAAIQERGSSEVALAERAGLDLYALQQLTAGTAAVTLAQVLRLAEALGLKWVDLIAEAGVRAGGLTGAPSPAPSDIAEYRLGTPGCREPLGEAHNVLSISHDADVVNLITLARALPRDTRRVFTLRKVYGLSYDLIASHLSIPVRDVERHLMTAVLACAQILEPSAWQRLRHRVAHLKRDRRVYRDFDRG